MYRYFTDSHLMGDGGLDWRVDTATDEVQMYDVNIKMWGQSAFDGLDELLQLVDVGIMREIPVSEYTV